MSPILWLLAFGYLLLSADAFFIYNPPKPAEGYQPRKATIADYISRGFGFKGPETPLITQHGLSKLAITKRALPVRVKHFFTMPH